MCIIVASALDDFRESCRSLNTAAPINSRAARTYHDTASGLTRLSGFVDFLIDDHKIT